jgi:hypothetical protein
MGGRGQSTARPVFQAAQFGSSVVGGSSSEMYQRRLFMFTIITANAILVWFVWGFFMALGWVLGTWIMEWLLGMVWRGRPPARREL